MLQSFKYAAASIAFVLFLSAYTSQMCADLVFTVDRVAGGPITVTGGGTGVATKGQTTDNWDILDFQTDYLTDQYPTAEQASMSASGILTNITTGLSENITEFRVDRDTTSRDDIRFFIANSLAFSQGDQYSLTLSAVFDPSVLFLHHLFEGDHIENSGGGADEIFGMTTLRVVAPEPSGIGLVSIAALGLVLLRRRWYR